MKKIFAIALALVMVLSMASAFALSSCDTRTFSWGCVTENTYCGTAKVEVVPYVHVNADCNGDEFVVSTCAGAVADENLYFAIKLTVDAYPYAPWFEKGYVDLEATGVTDLNWKYEDNDSELALSDKGINMDATEEEVYYWVDSVWKNVDDLNDDFVVGAPLYQFTAAKSAKTVKVCANIVSEYDGYSEANTVGDYTVWFDNGGNLATAAAFEKTGEFSGAVAFKDENGNQLTLTVDKGTVTNISDPKGIYADVYAKFDLGCGWVCVNKDNIKANFGWADEEESCFAWSKNASAIVDAECVVAIPKTGDVSVVAYAVMAVVAAAGTMLKK